jgi:asparagine synthase (glutamine-hydrolysing)
MCAIHGILTKRETSIDDMIKVAHHRGPDGNGKYIDDNISLGHNLLSIINTTELSKQPMYLNDWVLVFNGEIYNYKTLYSDAETDTEVILRGLQKHGVEFIHQLDGMFALAAYNKKTKELIIARDSNGAKPLFWGYLNGVFCFSSEIKSLLKIGFERKVSKKGFKQFYKQGLNAGYLTLFSGIRKLVPGEVVSINVKTDKRKSFNLNDRKIPLMTGSNIGKFSEEVRDRLQQSVKETLMGRRNVGLFLSGGIDSGAICYEMTQALNTKPRTFTSRFELKNINSRLNEDADLAKDLSKLHDTKHFDITVSDLDYINNWEKTFLALEEPRQSKSLPAYYCTNKFISEKDITVTLSGDGGDELFAGYKHHRFPNWSMKLKALSHGFPELKNKELYATQEEQEEYLNSWFPKGCLQGDRANDLMMYECLQTLAEDFLTRNDKLGMRFSMEARFPFLNKTIRDYVRAIPGDVKCTKDFMEDNWAIYNKWILKTAYQGRLPKWILNREKTGWRFPTDETIIGKMSDPAPRNNILKDYIFEILSNKDIQEIFEFTDKDIHDKYMNINDWNVEEITNKATGEVTKVAKPGIGIQSQKQLFTILAFAIWYKVYKMTI